MSHDYDAICNEATEWVRQAGRIACERFGSASVWRKEDRSPVTEADHAVQDFLLDAIARSFPEDAAITEETQSAPSRHQAVSADRRCWVIDPIDGTRNYARGMPIFSIAVGLMEGGVPVMGLVHDPVTGEMYRATAGGGAWLGERRLALAETPKSASVFISIPTSRHERLPRIVHEWIDRMVARNVGSTALHLAYLASGGLDAVYTRRNKLWDIAAGTVLVTEAGGELRGLDGRPHFPLDLTAYHNQEMPFLAGRPALVAELLAEYEEDPAS